MLGVAAEQAMDGTKQAKGPTWQLSHLAPSPLDIDGRKNKTMDIAHWLFLPDDAIDDLGTLSELSADQIIRLREFLDSSEFRPKYDFFVQVATLLGIRDEASARLCTFVNYIQRQRVKHNKKGESVPVELETFLKKAAEGPGREKAVRIIEHIREKRAQLARLFSDLTTYDFSQKVHGLETGPVPHLKSFRTYCDLRPVYDVEADAIVKSFPIITFCLVTHSTATDETKETLVQLTESDLDEFREQFERLQKKLEKLKNGDFLTAKGE